MECPRKKDPSPCVCLLTGVTRLQFMTWKSGILAYSLISNCPKTDFSFFRCYFPLEKMLALQFFRYSHDLDYKTLSSKSEFFKTVKKSTPFPPNNPLAVVYKRHPNLFDEWW